MKKFIGILFLAIIIGLPAFIYFSPMFERVPPKITFSHGEYWNLRDNLEIDIKDSSFIKYYKVTLINDGKVKVLKEVELSPSEVKKDIKIDVKLPSFYPIKGKLVTIKVQAIDNSKWNYFAGNEAKKQKEFYIDTIAPLTEVINNNYAMKRGGSGLAIVRVGDDNLKQAYIKVSDTENPNHFIKLKLTPFYKKGYFISLLVWPYDFKGFNAEVVATDTAGNLSTSHIPMRWRKARYPKVQIKISDKFIKQVAIPLLQKLGMNIPNNPSEIFKAINEKLRKIDEERLYKSTNIILDKKIDSFYIKPFKPMKGYAKKASYGEMRTYYYNGEKISFAVHKGLDVAKVAHSKVYSSNKGKVLFERFEGIYGNTLGLYHKLGLVSTYSHCSNFSVANGSFVSRGTLIARTGATGAVFGDHLHFGIYIQGIPVEPLEWMDSHWIKDNITRVIIKAKRIINR